MSAKDVFSEAKEMKIGKICSTCDAGVDQSVNTADSFRSFQEKVPGRLCLSCSWFREEIPAAENAEDFREMQPHTDPQHKCSSLRLVQVTLTVGTELC